MRFKTLITSLFVAVLASGAVGVNGQTTTVTVDCSQGQSINKALAKHSSDESLIIQINGICIENVVVTRDKVTLRGTSPTSDGIQAAVAGTPPPIDSAVWVKGAHQVSIENLKLTGGFAGLHATDVSTPVLMVVNSRLEGNAGNGAFVFNSIVRFEDTVFSSNGTINASSDRSQVIYSRCTFSNPLPGGPRINLRAGRSSGITLSESSLTDGGIGIGDSIVDINDSTIDAPPSEVSVSTGHSLITMRRVTVGGPMRFNRGSNVQLFGVTQTRNETENIADDSSFVRIGNSSPVSGGPTTIVSTILGFRVRNFSNGVLQETSQINGNLLCNQGANAFCANPANVSGSSSCGLCPKP